MTSHHVRRSGAELTTALLLVVAMLAAACSSDDGGEAAPAATDEVEATEVEGGVIQDLWVLVGMQSVGADGELVDIAEALAEPLEAGAGAPVELAEGTTFRPTPDLGVQLVDVSGDVRTDVAMDVGLLDHDGETGLVVLATPDAEADHVAYDDELVVDLSLVDDELVDGAALITDYVFAQTLPDGGDGAAEAQLGSLDLLAGRLARQALTYTALESDPTPLGIAGQVGAVDTGGAASGGSSSGGSSGPSAGSGSSDDDDDASDDEGAIGAPDAPLAVSLAAAPAGGGGGSTGGIPPKANPMIKGLGKGFFKCAKSFGSLSCVAKFFKSFGGGAAKSLGGIDRQLGPDPAPPAPSCTYNCGGSSGEPHLRTFDGQRYDLQTAGELVAARTEGLEVQVRTEPYGSSDRVSVNTGVAVGFDDGRVSATASEGDGIVIQVDGEVVDVEQLRAEPVEVGGGAVEVRTSTLLVTADDGTVVHIDMIGDRRFDLVVDVGEEATDWEGLFGDVDGDTGDTFVPQGSDEPIDPDDQEQLYGDFAESWRVTDETSLFDYADGESTETFTDRDFPTEPATLATLDPAGRAIAEQVCAAAQIQDDVTRQECVLDYALTDDVGFVIGAQVTDGVELVATGRLIVGDLSTAVIDIGFGDETPVGSDDVEWSWTIDERELLEDRGGEVATGEGIVVVRSRDTDDVEHLTAIELDTGDERWDIVDIDGSCRPVVTANGVVAQLEQGTVGAGDDANDDLVLLDLDTGETLGHWEPAPGADRLTSCTVALTALEDGTVLAVDGGSADVVRAFSTDGGLSPAWSAAVPANTLGWAPIVGGRPHLLVRADEDGESVAVRRLDPATGSTDAEVVVPGLRRFNQDPDGLQPMGSSRLAVVSATELEGTSPSVALLRSEDELEVEWTREFSDDDELRRRPAQLAAADDLVAGWTSSDEVGDGIGALDIDDGEPAWVTKVSSFDNTGGQISGIDGLGFFVSPFGGFWLENVVDGEPGWSIEEVPGLESPGTHTPLGQMLLVTGRIPVEGSAANGAYVALVDVDR